MFNQTQIARLDSIGSAEGYTNFGVRIWHKSTQQLERNRFLDLGNFLDTATGVTPQ